MLSIRNWSRSEKVGTLTLVMAGLLPLGIIVHQEPPRVMQVVHSPSLQEPQRQLSVQAKSPVATIPSLAPIQGVQLIPVGLTPSDDSGQAQIQISPRITSDKRFGTMHCDEQACYYDCELDACDVVFPGLDPKCYFDCPESGPCLPPAPCIPVQAPKPTFHPDPNSVWI